MKYFKIFHLHTSKMQSLMKGNAQKNLLFPTLSRLSNFSAGEARILSGTYCMYKFAGVIWTFNLMKNSISLRSNKQLCMIRLYSK